MMSPYLAYMDPWEAPRGRLKAALEAADREEVPAQNAWRVRCLEKLLAARLQAYYSANKAEEKRLQGLIDFVIN
jgi:hypothetical protein